MRCECLSWVFLFSCSLSPSLFSLNLSLIVRAVSISFPASPFLSLCLCLYLSPAHAKDTNPIRALTKALLTFGRELQEQTKLMENVRKHSHTYHVQQNSTVRTPPSLQHAQTHKQIGRQKDRQTDRRARKQGDRQTRQANGQSTHRQTKTHANEDTPNARVNAVLPLAPGLELQPLNLGVVPQPPHRHLQIKTNRGKQGQWTSNTQPL